MAEIKGNISKKTGKVMSYTTIAFLGADENGKDKLKRVTCKTRDEVKAEVVRLRQEFGDKKNKAEKPKTMTVREAFANYIEVNTGVLSPATLESYKNFAKNTFPSLHDVPLENLTSKLIQEAIDEGKGKRVAKLSPRSIHAAWAIYGAVIDRYMQEDAPRWRIKLPKVGKLQGNPSLLEDMPVVVNMISNTLIRKAMLFAAMTGLRREEICGLHWSDVDMDRRALYVNYTVVKGDKRWVLVPKTKTDDSVRFVDIPDEGLVLLNSLSRESEFVFPVSNPGVLTNAVTRMKRKAGLTRRLTFHSTRRFAVTLDMVNGVATKITQASVGHTNPEMTMHYQDISADERRKAAEKRDASLKRIFGKTANPENSVE